MKGLTDMVNDMSNISKTVETKAVFLDRDGVINIKAPEGDYIKSWSEFHFLSGAIEAIRKLNQNHRKPVWDDMKKAYKEGWQIFLSNLAVNLYTTSDIVILGLLTNNTIVGYYSGADKLINCIKRGIGAVNDAVYPFISKTMKNSKEQGICFLRKQLVVYIIGGIIGGFFLYVFSPWGVPWLLGPKYIPSIGPLRIMSFVPLVVAMNNVMGGETMLSLGMEKIYSKILMVASVFNLIIIYPLISWAGAEGTSWAVLCTETFVAIMMASTLWKNRILVRK